MNKIISVAIPTFNMESYLPRCLDSVLIDEALDSIEIIVVNDGSSDNSLEIAKAYKDKYPNSLVIIDKPNGHCGSCINAALQIASGKYFRPLDADDRFDSAAFVKFVSWLQTCDADMVVTNYSRDYLGGGRKIPVKHSSEKYANQLLEMHSITYRTQILHDTGYRQSEGILYTDWEYCFYPLAKVKSRAYFDVVLYRYTIGREGQSVSGEIYYKNRNHVYRIIQRMFDDVQEKIKNGQIMQESQCRNITDILYHYYCVILTHVKNDEDDQELRNIDGLLKKVNKGIYDELANKTYMRLLRPILLWRRIHDTFIQQDCSNLC
jgi:glycosyltransferase involved in cell wall biosynthesis